MSALRAIETPVAAVPAARSAAGADSVGRERSLRVVEGGAPGRGVQPIGGVVDATQPRSSSIERAANRRLSVRGSDQAPTAAIVSAPVGDALSHAATPRISGVRTEEVLTGTILVGGRQQRRGSVDPASRSDVSLRLTRRGRIVVAAAVVAVLTVAVLLVTMLVSGRAQATNHDKARAGYQGMHQVVVQPGQTLWSLAASAVPTADPRDVVQEIMAANALGSSSISAGQLLWVP